MRARWASLPSIGELQQGLESAWQAGFDRSGGAQLDYRAVSACGCDLGIANPGLCPSLGFSWKHELTDVAGPQRFWSHAQGR